MTTEAEKNLRIYLRASMRARDSVEAERLLDTLLAAQVSPPTPEAEWRMTRTGYTFAKLINYCQHKSGCRSQWRAATGSSDIGPCDCGLADAIALASSPPPEPGDKR